MPKKRYLVALLSAVGVLALLRYCDRDKVKPPTSVLPNNVMAIVTLDPSNSVTQTHQNTMVQTNYNHGTIVTVKPNGTVTVTPKTLGWTFDAGLAYSNRNRLSLVCELGFWRRLGWLAGVNVYPLLPNAWTAVSYRLQWKKLSNFSLYAGIDTDARFVSGIFWRFGNS
jgi:hypothetical protein